MNIDFFMRVCRKNITRHIDKHNIGTLQDWEKEKERERGETKNNFNNKHAVYVWDYVIKTPPSRSFALFMILPKRLSLVDIFGRNASYSYGSMGEFVYLFK